MDYKTLSSDQSLATAAANLAQNGIAVDIVDTKDQAKAKALSLIPEGSEVFTLRSLTTEQTGIAEVIDKSGKYNSVRAKFKAGLDENAKRKLGATPDYAVGSVHAVTEDGKILIASNTGSQLPADAYGAKKVIWVVGTQKIVKDVPTGLGRINTYILPLESQRSRETYNLPDTWNSFPSKILIIQKELEEGRIHLIFVKEVLGF